MDDIFGASVENIAVVLGVIFIALLGFLVFIGWRDFILVRMSVRNVRRRPVRGSLIILGLMLATAIISASFTVGDSITFSIKRNATDSLRALDEIVTVDKDADRWVGQAVPELFPQEVFNEMAPLVEADKDIDGIAPVLVEPIAVINFRTNQFDTGSLMTGVGVSDVKTFDPLFDLDGNLADLDSLAADELFIDKDGAEALAAERGDVLGLVLGPENIREMKIRAVVDGWYFKRENTSVVLMVSLEYAQNLLGKEGELSGIIISNLGDEVQGEKLTPAIISRYGTLPVIKDSGLEVYPIKSDIIEQANAAGNLFVSFFTTFGLFSIGVGLLLIFLIFSMLAAERKREMGISRAIGMQRHHLIRMFTVEGAIYGAMSAFVGVFIGVLLGFVLIWLTPSIFERDGGEAFKLFVHVEPTSVLVAFLMGSVITLGTVIVAARRISRLNIVRAIRDIPEPTIVRASRRTLIWGCVILLLGIVILSLGFQIANLALFGIGMSLIPVGAGLILRWRGLAPRWVLSGTGVFFLLYWLLPPSVIDSIKEDWSEDFSIFFISGALIVTGAVLIVINNSSITVGLIVNTLGRIGKFTPIIKSAISYPLRFGFRTGLSIAMFAVVIFSVVVMCTILEGFNKLFDDQQRLAGGYDVVAFSRSNLNPVTDLSRLVDAAPELDIIARSNEAPLVGTFRSIFSAEARLVNSDENSYLRTVLTGVDEDFVASNEYSITLATKEYIKGDGFDSDAIWRDVASTPGLAIVNSELVPTRNNFAFNPRSKSFRLNQVEGLFRENETIDPVEVIVRDLESGELISLTVVGMLDSFASMGLLMPGGIFTSTNTLDGALSRKVVPTQLFFKITEGVDDADNTIEAALFQHGLETVDTYELLESAQSIQRGFFNLLIGFMTLGLVVGTVAIGVISARAVVERRHEIGILRAIGYSRRMVQVSFLTEASFISLLGIIIGLVLGFLTSVNVISDIQSDEPNIQLIIPWTKILLIGFGAYLCTLVATLIPARQAAAIAPAEALRYE